jgi:inorganic pyrophosphatase
MTTPCVVLFLIYSCALFKKEELPVEDLLEGDVLSRSENLWNQGSADYQFMDANGNISKNPFFDSTSNANPSNRTIEFQPVVAADSERHLEFDIVSGKLYNKFNYCEQQDVWELYQKPISFPPYTLGFIPRTLDKLGEPQQIIVFGNEDFYFDYSGQETIEVRVVGALIEQICPVGNCTGGRSWRNRIIIIAVDPNDKNFSDVTTISGLKLKTDWAYFRAFRENGIGRNIIANSSFPGFRLAGEITAIEAMKYISTQTKIFSDEDLKILKNSCQKIFNFVWKHVGQVEENIKVKFSKKDLLQISEKDQKRMSGASKKERLEKSYFDPKLYNFKNNFIMTKTLFGDQLNTCFSFVKSSNINNDYKRHWFFAYYEAVFRLFELGMYFDCQNQVWAFNPIDGDSGYMIIPEQELTLCSEKSINLMFRLAPTTMETIANSSRTHYIYLDYDNGAQGTHNKIYNWVKFDNKELECQESGFKWPWQEKKNVKNDAPIVFPEDVSWNPIVTEETSVDNEKIVK